MLAYVQTDRLDGTSCCYAVTNPHMLDDMMLAYQAAYGVPDIIGVPDWDWRLMYRWTTLSGYVVIVA